VKSICFSIIGVTSWTGRQWQTFF